MTIITKWVECNNPPTKDGVYLVTTANGKVLCLPKVHGRGRYRPHRAWAKVPEGNKN